MLEVRNAGQALMRRICSTGRISLIAVGLTAAGCSWQPAEMPRNTAGAPTETLVPAATIGERAAAIALQQVGTPYRYCGQTPAGFDCSGLVHYAYRRAGKRVPRTTDELWSASPTVPRSDLRVGDLLFFSIGGKLQHVGLYVGDGRFAHAPSTGRTVTVESLSRDFYREALMRAGRPL